MCEAQDEHDDPHTVVRRGYDAVADRYLGWTANSAIRKHWLSQLLQSLRPRSRILDLGCGAGVPVTRELSNAGHFVLGVDNSAAQIELARQYVQSAEFLLGDVTRLALDEAAFDAVVAFYSITHVERRLHPELFSRVNRWLAPGGIFMASLGARDCPGWRGLWLGTEMYFSHFDAIENLRLLRSAGFQICHQAIMGEEENGSRADFLWVVAEKPMC